MKKDSSKKDKLGNAVVEAICKLLSCNELIECYKNRNNKETKNIKPEKRHTKRKAKKSGHSRNGKGKRSKKRSAKHDDDDDDDDNGIEILTQPKKNRKT